MSKPITKLVYPLVYPPVSKQDELFALLADADRIKRFGSVPRYKRQSSDPVAPSWVPESMRCSALNVQTTDIYWFDLFLQLQATLIQLKIVTLKDE